MDRVSLISNYKNHNCRELYRPQSNLVKTQSIFNFFDSFFNIFKDNKKIENYKDADESHLTQFVDWYLMCIHKQYDYHRQTFITSILTSNISHNGSHFRSLPLCSLKTKDAILDKLWHTIDVSDNNPVKAQYNSMGKPIDIPHKLNSSIRVLRSTKKQDNIILIETDTSQIGFSEIFKNNINILLDLKEKLEWSVFVHGISELSKSYTDWNTISRNIFKYAIPKHIFESRTLWETISPIKSIRDNQMAKELPWHHHVARAFEDMVGMFISHKKPPKATKTRKTISHHNLKNVVDGDY
jgi:hypothetical protein